jgi:ribosome biogenesis GTPase A
MGLAVEDSNLHSLPEALESFLIRAQEICNRFRILSLTRQIEACKNLLRQDQLIDVAILGQFKAGKSSFLNSLIGKPILPVGVIPVTTTITRLQYGKKKGRSYIILTSRRPTQTSPRLPNLPQKPIIHPIREM